MLFAVARHRRQPVSESAAGLGELWAKRPLKEELLDLLTILRDSSRLETRPIDPNRHCPLFTATLRTRSTS